MSIKSFLLTFAIVLVLSSAYAPYAEAGFFHRVGWVLTFPVRLLNKSLDDWAYEMLWYYYYSAGQTAR